MIALTVDGQHINSMDYAETMEAAERRSERSQAIREGIAAGRAESVREIELLKDNLRLARDLLERSATGPVNETHITMCKVAVILFNEVI
jgi:hypothetical protein